MAEITGGELLLRSLHAEGVKCVWAIPDGTYMIFLEALERLGDELGIRLLVPAHEAAGAHAADAMTRVTGEPAVVMACAGPGAANVISGVLCAQDEGSPVVAITTTRRSDIAYPHMGGMQVLDQLAYFKPAVKWNAQVNQWKRIPDIVRHAFRTAMAGRPGPVHIEIPEDLLLQRGDEESVRLWPRAQYRAAGQAADPALVRRAAELLADAEMACMHCGGGAQRSGAGEEVRALAEHLGCPVTTGAGSRGIVPEGHPLVNPPVSPATAVAHNTADVVLAVGTRFGELDFWGRPPAWADPARQRLIQIDVDPRNIGLNRPVEVALVGDARFVLGQLLEALREMIPPRPHHERIATLQAIGGKWRNDLDDALADLERAPMIPGQIFAVLNGILPADAIMALDGGNTCVWAAFYHRAQGQRSVLWTSNAGHLGTGLPYAIGAKLAAPERPVFCVSGDSAFRFNMQELETAARYNLPMVIIVAVDGAFGMEKTAQRRVWGREADWFGCDHAPVRFDQVAAAMGCHGEYIQKAAELAPAVERALASGKPVIIHAAVDPVENISPPGVAMWAAARWGAGGYSTVDVSVKDLAGRVALVTGGGSGIGRATAVALAEAGATVVVADIDEAAGRETVALLEGAGGRAAFVCTDVTRWEDLEGMVAFAEETFGGLHIVHNNAGINTGWPPFPRATREAWSKTIAVNLWAVIAVIQAALPAMVHSGGGVIVNTASLAGLVTYVGDPIYAATKHGVVGLTRALVSLKGEANVRVNCVCPGFVDTPLPRRRLDEMPDDERARWEALLAQIPMISPAEVADGVLELVRDESLTGEVMAIVYGEPRRLVPPAMKLL